MSDEIARRVQQFREGARLDQRAAAKVAGISQSTWQRIESGEKTPTLGQLAGIARALGRTVESVAGEGDVHDRLTLATRLKARSLTESEVGDVEQVRDHVKFLMEVDAHLRYIGIGQHE